MTTPRVLLVEDDASIRRFVSLALGPLPIQLVEAASLEEARRAWAGARFDLLITDLMLPDGNGLDLLESLAPMAGPAGGTRSVLFSAGVSHGVRKRAETLGVWRVLDKPAALAELVSCVTEALALSGGRRRQPARAPRASAAAAPGAADTRARAIENHFGGSASLYDAFRASSLAQFAEDLEAGDRACREGDAAALRRLAHSLKTVLLLLGADAASSSARALEQAAATTPEPTTLQPLWDATRAGVGALR